VTNKTTNWKYAISEVQISLKGALDDQN